MSFRCPIATHLAMTQDNPWETVHDPETGRPYYVNRVTNVTSWDEPADFRSSEA